MSNTSVAITITVIVLAVIGGVFWGGGNSFEDDQLSPATSSPATSSDTTTSPVQPEGWTRTTLASVQFSYPPEASVATENNRAKVQILGDDNQPNSEVTDGITAYLYSVTSNNRGLSATARSLFSARSSTAQTVVASTSEASFGGKSGYSFRLQNQLGSETQYFVLPSTQTGSALVASFTASGPNAQEFSDRFEEITETAQIIRTAGQETVQESNGEQSTSTLGGAESGLADGQACRDAGGRWLADYDECEYVRRSWCEKRGGTYNSCASACRNNPDAELCTQQCVPVCSL
jgi:hypothetical protein